MNEHKQPEALRLADECDEHVVDFANVAAELRRLYHEVQRLQADLDDIDYQNSMQGDR